MNQSLTIQIVVKNNESTIEQTLRSLTDLKANILVADLGCSDKTIKICEQYKANVIKTALNNSMSAVKNNLSEMAKTEWIMQINPWEVLIQGHEEIIKSTQEKSAAYNFHLIQEDVITKQIRLWHKKTQCRFINPVFEIITGESEDLQAFLSIKEHNDSNTHKLLEFWRNKFPLATEPIYYYACYHLKNKNWDAFLNFSEMYLHQEKKQNISFFMTQYYCSMVNCYIKKYYDKAVRYLLPCIAKNPTMAEFWCLLGDIYYAVKDFKRAEVFYENAILLGSKRLKNNNWPLEISKYKEYPTKMIQNCKTSKNNQKLYISK